MTQQSLAVAPGLRIRLSVMMFGQFAIMGGWYVTLGTYLSESLNATGQQIALAYLCQSIGSIVAPLFVGRIADQFFAAQRVLGVLHLAGGAVLLFASRLDSFATFFPMVLLYMMLFTPTNALSSSITFGHLPDPSRQFPGIRVLGTVGWVAAGLLVGWLGWEQSGQLELTLILSGCIALALGAYSFLLPHTPPHPGERARRLRDILGLEALGLLRDRTYLVFFLSSIAICVPLAFYYNFTNLYLNEIGVGSAAAVQSIGQMSEAAFLLVLPVIIKRFGFKATLAIGMSAWALRFLLFGFGDTGALFFMIIIGLVLHGICFDFIFLAGQIYTNQKAGPGLRSSAQGLITLATQGVGLLIGTLLSGQVVDAFVVGEAHNWLKIWMIPAVAAVVVLIAFCALFRERDAARSS